MFQEFSKNKRIAKQLDVVQKVKELKVSFTFEKEIDVIKPRLENIIQK
jgi:hypothetical protein